MLNCPICFDRVDSHPYVAPNCFHTFHHHCLDTWIKTGSHTCPMCRSDLALSPRGPLELEEWNTRNGYQ